MPGEADSIRRVLKGGDDFRDKTPDAEVTEDSGITGIRTEGSTLGAGRGK
jgi:hypothetical protein